MKFKNVFWIGLAVIFPLLSIYVVESREIPVIKIFLWTLGIVAVSTLLVWGMIKMSRGKKTPTSSSTQKGSVFGSLVMSVLIIFILWGTYTRGDKIVKNTDATRALANAIAEANLMKKDDAERFVDTLTIQVTRTGSRQIEIPKGAKVVFERMEYVSYAMNYETTNGQTGSIKFLKDIKGTALVPPNLKKVEFVSLEENPVRIIFMSTKPLESQINPNKGPRIIAGAVTYLIWLFRYCGLEIPKVLRTSFIKPYAENMTNIPINP